MKKAILMPLIIIAVLAPAFAQEQESGGESFGLQADIFRYVLTNSNSLLSSSSGYTNNFEALEDYPLTPGDIFTLIINYGPNSERSADYITTYQIQLQPDYNLVLPYIGDVNVRGKNVSELQALISDQIGRITPVQFISFNLAAAAQFNVFIYGGVNVSGYINATPVTTVVDAISMCKGFKPNASYRDVRIIRAGKEISVDISSFYKNADFAANPRLQPGDRIYVPMAGKVVNIQGQVKYPGIYEVLEGEDMADLVRLAGGYTPGANMSLIEISRISPDGVVQMLTPKAAELDGMDVSNGDTVTIPTVSQNSRTITIEGAVYGRTMPGTAPFAAPTTPVKLEIPYYPGISLLNVLDKVGGPTPYAIMSQAQIRRSREGEFVSADIENLWTSRNPEYDITLKPGDHILLPIEKTFVGVYGALNASDNKPATISHVNGYTVLDYIMLAGGLNYSTADPNNILLIDREGNRKNVKLEDEVPPGSIIYCGKNILRSSDEIFQNIIVVTTWVTVTIGIVNTIWDFVDKLQTAAQ